MIILKLISFIVFCLPVFAVDIVQIDVGNEKNFTGILDMRPNDKTHKSRHGTYMAEALEDELKHQRSKPATAKQLLWDYDISPRTSLLFNLSKVVKEKPRVLSLSLGGKIYDELEAILIDKIADNDVVIVAAAGNSGGGKQYYPANYKNPCILSVGTTVNKKRADYSNDAMVWLEYNEKDPKGTSSSTARMAAIVLQIRRSEPKASCSDIVLTMRMLYGTIKK